MDELVIGRRDGDHVVIQVHGRLFPEANDHHDGNWLVSPVAIRAGSFAAVVSADLRAEELHRFRERLQEVLAVGFGHAALDSAEDRFSLDVDVDPDGSVIVDGFARADHAAVGRAELEFALDWIDCTELAPLVEALLECEAAHPVRGTPDGERLLLRRPRR